MRVDTRLTAQGLAGVRATTAEAAVARVVVVQAQAPGPPRLAIRARTDGVTASDVDSATADGRLVRTWLLRGTLHLAVAEDLRWLVGLCGPVFAAAGRRRRERLGLDEEVCRRAFAVLREVLADGRPRTRAELMAEVTAAGVPVDVDTQAPPHLLAYGANTGLLCRGPGTGSAEPTYVLLDDYVPPAEPMPRAAALVELARRYLAGHGPATEADFRYWTGFPARDTKPAFAALDVVELSDGTVALPDTDLAPAPPPTRLLGHFDPLLLTYRDRTPILDPAHAGRIQTGGGFVQPAILAGGRVVGTWALRGNRVEVEPFTALPPLDGEIADLARFLGRPVSAMH
jgi:winged helix DNA-binding protein